MSQYPICVRCNKPVKVSKDQYEVFERMHWLCFHLEFEHGDFDPDEPCEDPSCPWNRIHNWNDWVWVGRALIGLNPSLTVLEQWSAVYVIEKPTLYDY